MAFRPSGSYKTTVKYRSNLIPFLIGVSLVAILCSTQMFNTDLSSIQKEDICSIPQDSDFENPSLIFEERPTRSDPQYNELVDYSDVLIIRNLNSAMSMQVADYFQSVRNISNLNICNITTSTSETVNRDTFEDEIRTPIENYIISNGLFGSINYIVTTKGVPLRVSQNAHTWDRACVDSELTLILGPYSSQIGNPYWFNNPYFDPEPYDDFSFLKYGFFLVSRLTGYNFDDIKAMIDKVESSIGQIGRFVFDVDPGRDDGGGYQMANNWMREAHSILTTNGFNSFLDETDTFLTNRVNTSGYTSWGSNDGHYPTNSLLNTGLESDGNGDDVPDNWYFINDTGIGSCERNDTEVRNGAWSVRISRNNTNENSTYIAQNYTVKPETRYYVAGYANLSGVSSDMGVHLQIKSYDSQGKVIKFYNGSARTGTTGYWVSLSQVHFEPISGISNISVGVALSKSSGTVFVDDISFYEIKPHNSWIPGALAETYVSTGGRSFNYPTAYGQSLVADLIRDGVTGVKGYVYEPYLDACAHPNILFDAYTQGFSLAESYYMASAYLGWMDVVVGDPKLSPYDPDLVPDVAIFPNNISFSDKTPREGDVIDIIADVQNLGPMSVSNVTIDFYEGEPISGLYLGTKMVDVKGLSSNLTSLTWDTTGHVGDYDISVVADLTEKIYEANKSNNMATNIITVNTGYPTANAGSDAIVDEDTLFTFNGSGSHDNTSIANYTWDFRDGGIGYGVYPNHTYNSSGIYQVILNVTNTFGLWDLATMTLTVHNVAPIANAGEDKSGYEGIIIFFNASGSSDTPSDVDSLNYTWYFGDGDMGYGFEINHTYGDDGLYVVTLEVTDDDLEVDLDTVDVSIANIDPVISQVSSKIAKEDSQFTLNILASDVSADTITFSDNSTMFDIDPITGVINFTPLNAHVGNYIINITATDDDGGESHMEFALTVENTNDPPRIVSTPIIEAIENSLYRYDVVVEDDDMLAGVEEEFTYYLQSEPFGMEINSTGSITWIPNDYQAFQMFSVIVKASDGEEFDVQTFNINVTNVNDDPIIISEPITSAVEDQEYEYNVEASDVDNDDVLTYKLELAPEGMGIDSGSGIISWLPTNGLVGGHYVIVNVSDLTGAYDIQNFTIYVENVNDAPALEHIGKLSAVEDEPFLFSVNATDVDLGDTLSFFDDSLLFEINKHSGVISFTPSNDDVGTYTIKISVSDSGGLFDEEVIEFIVLNVNDPPTLESIGNWWLIEDKPFYLEIEAQDIDYGDIITFLDNTTLFDIDSETGEISLTPTNGDVGVYIVNITVMDENGGFAYQTVKFTVLNVADPPVINVEGDIDLDKTIILEVGEPFTLKINATDIDSDDTLVFNDDSDILDIDPETGEITFLPEKDDIGIHYIEITVTDSEGNEDSLLIKIEVVGKPDDDDNGVGANWIALFLILGITAIIIVLLTVYLFGKKAKRDVQQDVQNKQGGQNYHEVEEPVEFQLFQEESEEKLVKGSFVSPDEPESLRQTIIEKEDIEPK